MTDARSSSRPASVPTCQQCGAAMPLTADQREIACPQCGCVYRTRTVDMGRYVLTMLQPLVDGIDAEAAESRIDRAAAEMSTLAAQIERRVSEAQRLQLDVEAQVRERERQQQFSLFPAGALGAVGIFMLLAGGALGALIGAPLLIAAAATLFQAQKRSREQTSAAVQAAQARIAMLQREVEDLEHQFYAGPADIPSRVKAQGGTQPGAQNS